MAKSRQAQARLRAVPGVDLSRVGDLAHWTVCPLGEGFGALVPIIAKALGTIDLPPFAIEWDRLVSTGGHLMLTSSRRPKEVAKLRRYIRKQLGDAGIHAKDKLSEPHVTLNYTCTEPVFEREIEPIRWAIDEVLLIESVTGKKRHVAHARFEIRPRQSMLFPLTRCLIGGGTLIPSHR
jgi:2'-5' RNA ligase